MLKYDEQMDTGLWQHRTTKVKYMVICAARSVSNVLNRVIVIQQLEDNKDFWFVPEKEFFDMYTKF